MKQVVHIIRKEDVEKKLILGLKLELDYELASLFDALQNPDQEEIERSKARLAEIHQELEVMNALQ